MIQEKICQGIINLYNKEVPTWNSAKYIFTTGSYESISYTSESILYDKNGDVIPIENISVLRISDEVQNLIIQLLKDYNIVSIANKLVIIFKQKKVDTFTVEWDQAVHEESIKYVSKKKLETLRAWYLPDDGIVKEPAAPQILPKPGVILDTGNLSIDKAFNELNKIVTYKNDPLWDGGFYSIVFDGKTWKGECCLYLFDSMESKEKNWGADEVSFKLVITEEMKRLFCIFKIITSNKTRKYHTTHCL